MTTVRAPQRTERRRPERRAPELRVVESGVVADRRRSPASVLGTLAVVLLFAALFGVVVFQVFLVQTQFRLDDLNRQVAGEEELARDLGLRTAELEAPERIVRDARDRLGMIPPGDVVYLEPRADDDQRAAFDPAKETTTTTAPPATTPPTTAWKPSATTTPTTAWKPPATTTPTTAWKPPATTTPTTAWKPPATTTPTTAWKPPTTTVGTGTR